MIPNGERPLADVVVNWSRLLAVPVLLALAASLWLAASASAYVYWAAYGDGLIGRANLNGTAVDRAFLPPFYSHGEIYEPTGLAVDSHYIYWAGGGIGRANLNGTGFRTLIRTSSHPAGLAVRGPYIYWSIGGSWGTIARANTDGTQVNEFFVRDVYGVSGLAVSGSHIYWITGGAIGRASLAGQNKQTFIAGVLSNAYSLTVQGSHIYWANEATGTIGRANLDGTGVNQRFITGAIAPRGVAIAGDHIYWLNNHRTPPFGMVHATIGRANLNGTGVNQRFIKIPGSDRHYLALAADGLKGPPTLVKIPTWRAWIRTGRSITTSFVEPSRGETTVTTCKSSKVYRLDALFSVIGRKNVRVSETWGLNGKVRYRYTDANLKFTYFWIKKNTGLATGTWRVTLKAFGTVIGSSSIQLASKHC